MRGSPASPDWTDYNESDPGITLLQLLAYALGVLAFVAAVVGTSKARTKLRAR
jgi:hypothetical protein